MRADTAPIGGVPRLPIDMRRLRQMRRWLAALPLYWRVFGTNALGLTLAAAALVFAPVTVSVPVALSELVIVLAGFAVLLALNLVMLRAAFRPLDELGERMRRHDPLCPGERVAVDGEPDIAALAATFNDMLDRLESERRESARQALRVQEGERRRIARELHDQVGQTLTGVMLQVEGIAASAPYVREEQLDELRETARHGIEDVRRIASRLRPEALEDLGLHSALSALATRFAERGHVRVERRLERIPSLGEEEELVIYRVAQEALTNVARHADARRVELSLERRDDRVVLTVSDDGRGIRPGELSSSHGIHGMRERAMLVGGQISIHGAPGRGTQVRLSIPVRTEVP